jgi:arsenite oxidase small subunit
MWNKLERYLREITVNIRREREIDLNRRGFIVSSLSLIGLMFVTAFPFAARAMLSNRDNGKPLITKIAEADELQAGESKVFHYPDEGKPAILVRLDETNYRSYYNKCTHLQCPVYWDKPSGQLVCPCHNGVFNVEDGSVIAGPPPRPLPGIQLDFRSDGIYAVGPAENVPHKGSH